jgi:hypothetical protein
MTVQRAKGRAIRVEDLCRNVVPAKALKADAPLALKDKKGVEKKYGGFLAKVLGDEAVPCDAAAAAGVGEEGGGV